MGHYSKSLCPKCKTTLEGWRRTYIAFGNPFVGCPSCKTVVRKSHINEWEVMSRVDKGVYSLDSYVPAIIIGGGGTWLLGVLFDQVSGTEIFTIDWNPNTFHLVIILVAATASLLWSHKKFQEKISDSKERMKNVKYRKMFGLP